MDNRNIFLIALILFVGPAVSTTRGQDVGAMTAREREEYLAAIRARSVADHQKMMALLNIHSLRPGVNGSDPLAPNAANYDEAKANPYPELPDPLRLTDGKKVRTAAQWKKRRAEIMEAFDREIYGRLPGTIPHVTWQVAETVSEMKDTIAVITKKLSGVVDNSVYPDVTVAIQLTLTVPAAHLAPVPVVMELSFGRFPGMPQPAAQPAWQRQVLERGWGYAVLIPTSIQPDHGAGLAEGIIGLVNKGQSRKPDDWGALRAWAWGASRALDYFETDPAVDARSIAVAGHSRYGKAALVAMAYDTRFAAAYISSSGAGGAKLHRRNAGETVENVAGPGEYHWMAGNYLKYAGPLQWDDLPVDSHELIALCAPRPVFIGAGLEGDGWVDPRGMFLAAVSAGPVYRLLGKNDLGTTDFPPPETALTGGDIAFRQHRGGHTPAPNWPFFLSFAARYFEAPKR